MAAKRPTASDEVARGRLVSLDGFAFAFRTKNGEWRDSHLGFQVSLACVQRPLTSKKSERSVCDLPLIIVFKDHVTFSGMCGK